MAALETLRRNLRIPAIAAPMFLVSGPQMVVAACKAGIVGSFPTPNARTGEALECWLTEIEAGLADCTAPACYAANLVVHRSNPRLAQDLAAVVRHRVPVVITALGSPREVVDAVHSYGGVVLADVNSVGFARKAAASGVDGLVLVAAGAGGHTGRISGFAFVEEVRRFWSGPIVLGGAIASGRAVRAAEVLGADFAYLGTSLLACTESLASAAYKDMVVKAGAEDIIASRAITGVTANWLRASLVNAGYDPAAMPEDKKPNFADAHNETKAWKHVWSAGHGVGAVTEITPLASVVERLAREYAEAVGKPGFVRQEGTI